MEFCPKCNGVMLPGIIDEDGKEYKTEKELEKAEKEGKTLKDVFKCVTCNFIFTF